MDFRLQECLDALGTQKKLIYDEKKQDEIMAKFDQDFPLTPWGRIDWNQINKKYLISLAEEAPNFLMVEEKSTSKPIYIIWGDADTPIIETDFTTTLRNLYDVVTTRSDTWLYCPTEGWVIEFHHDGEITLGIV